MLLRRSGIESGEGIFITASKSTVPGKKRSQLRLLAVDGKGGVRIVEKGAVLARGITTY